jgi:hypothetical protein
LVGDPKGALWASGDLFYLTIIFFENVEKSLFNEKYTTNLYHNTFSRNFFRPSPLVAPMPRGAIALLSTRYQNLLEKKVVGIKV